MDNNRLGMKAFSNGYTRASINTFISQYELTFSQLQYIIGRKKSMLGERRIAYERI